MSELSDRLREVAHYLRVHGKFEAAMRAIEAADALDAQERRIEEMEAALSDLLAHADGHHLSHATCVPCGDRCFEEWCIVKDTARAALASTDRDDT